MLRNEGGDMPKEIFVERADDERCEGVILNIEEAIWQQNER